MKKIFNFILDLFVCLIKLCILIFKGIFILLRGIYRLITGRSKTSRIGKEGERKVIKQIKASVYSQEEHKVLNDYKNSNSWNLCMPFKCNFERICKGSCVAVTAFFYCCCYSSHI